MNNTHPTIVLAILDNNALTRLGLRNLLEDIIPVADIKVFEKFSEMEEAGAEQFVHFFVASRIYFENSQFFRRHHKKTIVLVNGDIDIAGMKKLNVCQEEKQLMADIMALHSHGHSQMMGHPGMPPIMEMTPEEMYSGHPDIIAPTRSAGHPVMGHPAHIHMGNMHPMSKADIPHPHNADAVADTVKDNEEQEPEGLPMLSAREVEVVTLLCKGYMNKEVAEELNISLATAVTHRKNIMNKMQAKSLAEVVIRCVMRGIVNVEDI